MNKLQKIKDWISKEQDGLMDAQGNFEYPEHEEAYHILCNLDAYIDSLKEEPVSEELLKASMEFAKDFGEWDYAMPCFQAGAEWQKEKLWKDAQGDDLPEIDREVIVLVGVKNPVTTDSSWGCEVAFAHRPNPNGWDGKSITTGEVEHYDVKTYDKGGWNIPDVRFWLDCELPKIEE